MVQLDEILLALKLWLLKWEGGGEGWGLGWGGGKGRELYLNNNKIRKKIVITKKLCINIEIIYIMYIK